MYSKISQLLQDKLKSENLTVEQLYEKSKTPLSFSTLKKYSQVNQSFKDHDIRFDTLKGLAEILDISLLDFLIRIGEVDIQDYIEKNHPDISQSHKLLMQIREMKQSSEDREAASKILNMMIDVFDLGEKSEQ